MATPGCPPGRLTGKRCLVTGAAQGIGRAAVEAFLKEGAALVVAIDIQKDKLQELSSQSDRVATRVLDARNTAALKALPQDFPEIDVLFNCVGYMHSAAFLDTTEEEWDDCFAINVKTTFILSQAYIPQMIRRGSGSIINMSSAASHLRGLQLRAAYGAAKAAVVGLTKAVAREFVRDGVRCNTLCPSLVDTPGTKANKSVNIPASDKAHFDHIMNDLMGRPMRPEEVANLCVYLASDESTYHTGNVFVIDGGYTL